MKGSNACRERTGRILEPIQPSGEDAGSSAVPIGCLSIPPVFPLDGSWWPVTKMRSRFRECQKPPTTTGSAAALVDASSLLASSVKLTYTLMTSPLSHDWMV